MNSVNIIGFLRENIDDTYRYFEYELPYMEENPEVKNIIVLKNWTNQPGSIVNSYPANTRVAVHGHLDAHVKFGTIIVVEEIQQVR